MSKAELYHCCSRRIKLLCLSLLVLALILVSRFRSELSRSPPETQPIAADRIITTLDPSINTTIKLTDASTTQQNPVERSTVSERRNVDVLAKPTSWNASAEPKTVAAFFRYLRRVEPGACEIANEMGGKLIRLHHFTGKDGQKKICLDKGVAPDPHSCLVYSFGINNEWSFDDSIADYGCEVFAFDPSMKQKDSQRSERIKFFRTGLSANDSDKDKHGWRIRTFSTLRRELGHENRTVDVLKIDIEGAEWAVLEHLVVQGALKDVKQLAVEIHMGGPSTISNRIAQYWNILQSIEKEGFVKFSSDQNPFVRMRMGDLTRKDSPMYEVAWFNKKYLH